MKQYIFNIDPVAKPRMVNSDKWKKREAVQRYWKFKHDLNILAYQARYTLGDVLNIAFYLPMPKSWSKNKQSRMFGEPHQQKPDLDNLVKSFWDSLSDSDMHIYEIKAGKYWDEKGRIEVYE